MNADPYLVSHTGIEMETAAANAGSSTLYPFSVKAGLEGGFSFPEKESETNRTSFKKIGLSLNAIYTFDWMNPKNSSNLNRGGLFGGYISPELSFRKETRNIKDGEEGIGWFGEFSTELLEFYIPEGNSHSNPKDAISYRATAGINFPLGTNFLTGSGSRLELAAGAGISQPLKSDSSPIQLNTSPSLILKAGIYSNF